MDKDNNNFYKDLYQANIMPDGLLNPVSYQDYALMMVLKDKEIDNDRPKYDFKDIKE